MTGGKRLFLRHAALLGTLAAALAGCRQTETVGFRQSAESDSTTSRTGKIGTTGGTGATSGDTIAPTISSLTVPATSTSLTVTGISASVTDNVGVTGYFLSEDQITPSASAPGWSATLPSSFICSGAGSRLISLWVRDAAGNISGRRGANTTITLPDTTAPTLSSFVVPASSTSMTVTGISALASDNVGVNGYYVGEETSPPLANAGSWVGAVANTYRFPTVGAKTLRVWAKDAAGNISAPRTATVSVALPHHDLVPLWESVHLDANDTFYTMNMAESLNARTAYGYQQHSVVAWVPCSKLNAPGPAGQIPGGDPNNDMGYPFDMKFTCAPPAGAAPLFRFYKGGAASDHFYTVSASEANFVSNNGWVFERVEGYLFLTQQEGTVPLYRLSRCLVTSTGECDIQHRFTLSLDTKTILVNAGWGYDGIAGYAFDGYNNSRVTVTMSGTYNGIPVSPTAPLTTFNQDVIPTKGAVAVNGTGRAVGSGMFASNSSFKPAGATQQRITFTLNTGTLFDESSNLDHMPVVLLSNSQLARDGIIGHPYNGIGIFLAKPNWNNNFCNSTATSGAQILIEGYAMAKFVECAPLSSPIKANQNVRIEVTASADGTVSYSVTNVATGANLGTYSKNFASYYSCPLVPSASNVKASDVHCHNPWSYDRYPNFRTGYAIVPIFGPPGGAVTAGNGTLSGVTIQWLNAGGAVLSTQ